MKINYWTPHIVIYQVFIDYTEGVNQREFFLFYRSARMFIEKNQEEICQRKAKWSICGKYLWICRAQFPVIFGFGYLWCQIKRLLCRISPKYLEHEAKRKINY